MIKKLSQNIINLLAAWEVVERPYSVVKELVENSLDAGADYIEIDIENGWKNLIRVFDNGEWIKKEDLPLSIEEHATSKISKIDDIYNIHSFWFRWEALSTISEVSKFVIITKTKNDDIAYKLEKVWKEVNIEWTNSNFQNWTNIFVKDLFYNIPVRQKFLKSKQTEFKYIKDLVDDFAIKNYNVNFKLIHNWKVVSEYKKTEDLLSRINQIYPKEWEQNYLFVDHNDEIYKVYWVIWKSILKFNSPSIKIFVNQRPVKNKIIQRAILQAYSRWIEPKMSPFCILFLDIKKDLLDVNVHPRKEEVKFVDPGSIYNLVYNLIKNTIEWNLNNLDNKSGLEKKTNYIKFQASSNKISKNNLNWEDIKKINDNSLDIDFNKNNIISNNNFENKNKLEDIIIVWQIFDSYILFQKWEDFYIMDQHAVAERIIFEKMRKEFDKDKQTLLTIPITIEVKIDIDKKLDILRQYGFDISYFWNNKVIVYSIPSVLEKYKVDISSFLNNLLHSEEDDISLTKILEYTLATKSCKAAIKANHKLSVLEMEQLIKDWLENIDWFFVCQHGRPSVVRLSKHDIDGFFDRK